MSVRFSKEELYTFSYARMEERVLAWMDMTEEPEPSIWEYYYNQRGGSCNG